MVEEKKDEVTQQTQKVQLRKWATIRMNNRVPQKSYKDLVAEREPMQRKRAEEEEIKASQSQQQDILKSGYLEYFSINQGTKISWSKQWFVESYYAFFFDLIEYT